MLTRQEMIKIIVEDKGSVLYKGVVINRDNMNELPSVADLALEKGGTAKEDAKAELAQQLKDLQEQFAKLEDKTGEEAKADAKTADAKKKKDEPQA